MGSAGTEGKRIVVVTGGGPQVWALVNAVTDTIGPVSVVLEQPESKWPLLRARARRHGWISAGGQLGTMLMTRFMKRFANGRSEKTIAEHQLRIEPAPHQVIVPVASANSAECVRAIAELKADIILLNGCRMLSRTTLSQIGCPVLNYHAGITPKYRGMNGGYWSLATGDSTNFGTTVHLVDAGVDTGGILKQVRGTPKPGDSIATYPLTMAAFSSATCVEAIRDVLAERIQILHPDLPSQQWYHPTIWFYLWTGMTRRVW